VGNNKYEVAGLEIGRRLSLTSGQLWVCTAPRPARRNLIGMAWRTLTGHVSDHELNAIEVEEIWVDAATPRLSVSMDGEVSLMAAPLHYRIRPGALGVVLPAASEARSNDSYQSRADRGDRGPAGRHQCRSSLRIAVTGEAVRQRRKWPWSRHSEGRE
jgi:hypothetical protein